MLERSHNEIVRVKFIHMSQGKNQKDTYEFVLMRYSKLANRGQSYGDTFFEVPYKWHEFIKKWIEIKEFKREEKNNILRSGGQMPVSKNSWLTSLKDIIGTIGIISAIAFPWYTNHQNNKIIDLENQLKNCKDSMIIAKPSQNIPK